MTLSELAPAKINLFLHVGRPGADGYHDLASLMVFADLGDRVCLEPGGSGFALTGPFAAGLEGEGDNLVTRARDLFIDTFGGAGRTVGLTLNKTLPIAAGLGGGSADAAATLRLLAEAFALPAEARLHSGALGEMARTLGADVAACLASVPVVATGRGDTMGAAPRLPSLPAVLVNPLKPSPTGAVYRAFDEDEAWAPLGAALPSRLERPADVASWLRTTRNDLQPPAVRLTPEIGEVLRELDASPESLMARMSGSGATCFALCDDDTQAASLAQRISKDRPGWWVKSCRFTAAIA